MRRKGVEFKTSLIVGEVPKDPAISYMYLVGAAYLVIGLFVYFRRGSAHKARHFYLLCLTSFIAFSFHYTGHLDAFDIDSGESYPAIALLKELQLVIQPFSSNCSWAGRRNDDQLGRSGFDKCGGDVQGGGGVGSRLCADGDCAETN